MDAKEATDHPDCFHCGDPVVLKYSLRNSRAALHRRSIPKEFYKFVGLPPTFAGTKFPTCTECIQRLKSTFNSTKLCYLEKAEPNYVNGSDSERIKYVVLKTEVEARLYEALQILVQAKNESSRNILNPVFMNRLRSQLIQSILSRREVKISIRKTDKVPTSGSAQKAAALKPTSIQQFRNTKVAREQRRPIQTREQNGPFQCRSVPLQQSEANDNRTLPKRVRILLPCDLKLPQGMKRSATCAKVKRSEEKSNIKRRSRENRKPKLAVEIPRRITRSSVLKLNVNTEIKENATLDSQLPSNNSNPTDFKDAASVPLPAEQSPVNEPSELLESEDASEPLGPEEVAEPDQDDEDEIVEYIDLVSPEPTPIAEEPDLVFSPEPTSIAEEPEFIQLETNQEDLTEDVATMNEEIDVSESQIEENQDEPNFTEPQMTLVMEIDPSCIEYHYDTNYEELGLENYETNLSSPAAQSEASGLIEEDCDFTEEDQITVDKENISISANLEEVPDSLADSEEEDENEEFFSDTIVFTESEVQAVIPNVGCLFQSGSHEAASPVREVSLEVTPNSNDCSIYGPVSRPNSPLLESTSELAQSPPDFSVPEQSAHQLTQSSSISSTEEGGFPFLQRIEGSPMHEVPQLVQEPQLPAAEPLYTGFQCDFSLLSDLEEVPMNNLHGTWKSQVSFMEECQSMTPNYFSSNEATGENRRDCFLPLGPDLDPPSNEIDLHELIDSIGDSSMASYHHGGTQILSGSSGNLDHSDNYLTFPDELFDLDPILRSSDPASIANEFSNWITTNLVNPDSIDTEPMNSSSDYQNSSYVDGPLQGDPSLSLFLGLDLDTGFIDNHYMDIDTTDDAQIGITERLEAPSSDVEMLDGGFNSNCGTEAEALASTVGEADAEGQITSNVEESDEPQTSSTSTRGRRKRPAASEHDEVTPAKKVRCTIGRCNYQYNPDTETVEYKAHIVRKHEGKKYCFICNTCGRGFKDRKGLETHENWHKGLFPFACVVDGCGKKFRNQRQFKLHNQNYHPSPGKKLPYRCEFCSKGYLKKYNFELHLRSHTGERPIQCESCGKTFKSASNLRYHRDRCLGKDTFHACPDCGKKYANKSSLQGHRVKMHDFEDPKTVRCEECGYISTNGRIGLKRHVQMVHSQERSEKCTLCVKEFKTKSTLQAHVKSVHSKVRPHMCYICDRGFIVKSKLQRHMIIHAGIKNTMCGVCSKTFYDTSAYNRHYRSAHVDAKAQTAGTSSGGNKGSQRKLRSGSRKNYNEDEETTDDEVSSPEEAIPIPSLDDVLDMETDDRQPVVMPELNEFISTFCAELDDFDMELRVERET